MKWKFNLKTGIIHPPKLTFSSYRSKWDIWKYSGNNIRHWLSTCDNTDCPELCIGPCIAYCWWASGKNSGDWRKLNFACILWFPIFSCCLVSLGKKLAELHMKECHVDLCSVAGVGCENHKKAIFKTNQLKYPYCMSKSILQYLVCSKCTNSGQFKYPLPNFYLWSDKWWGRGSDTCFLFLCEYLSACVQDSAITMELPV